MFNSLFHVPGDQKIGARVRQTQHEIHFQHSAFLVFCIVDVLLKVCVENFKNRRGVHFTLCYVFKMRAKIGVRAGRT